jgi:hypothetical protein
MGMDYSIRIYVSKAGLKEGIQWLNQNTEANNKQVSVKLFGERFTLNGHRDGPLLSLFHKADTVDFTTSLILDLDTSVLKSLEEGSWVSYRSRLDEITRYLKHNYRGDGKVAMGGFDASVTRLKYKDLVEFSFTAVTSDMSIMLEESIAVRKWIADFSDACKALMSYVDLESDGTMVYYYQGAEVDFRFSDISGLSKTTMSNGELPYSDKE